MRITCRKIQASSDFRIFDAYSVEEAEEMIPEIYYDFFYDVRNDVNQIYVSKNPLCTHIGAQDSDGRYFVYDEAEPEFGPGWFEVTFAELSDYLK